MCETLSLLESVGHLKRFKCWNNHNYCSVKINVAVLSEINILFGLVKFFLSLRILCFQFKNISALTFVILVIIFSTLNLFS